VAQAERPDEETSELVKAYQRPYHPPCSASDLLEALRCGALKSSWPFRGDIHVTPAKQAA
jgi:hypothetical protein